VKNLGAFVLKLLEKPLHILSRFFVLLLLRDLFSAGGVFGIKSGTSMGAYTNLLSDSVSKEVRLLKNYSPSSSARKKGWSWCPSFFPRILRRAAALLETSRLTLLVYQLAFGLKSGDKHHMLERA